MSAEDPLTNRKAWLCSLLLLLCLSAWSWLRQPTVTPTPVEAQSDQLVFEDVTLDQPNERGERLWKLRAVQATYSPSGSQAKVDKPRGKLFRGEQELYEIEANEGEVNQDGETIVLRGKVFVQDLRDGAALRADEAEWLPNEDSLTLRGQVVGTQEGLQIRASEGIWQDSSNEIRLTGTPVLTTVKEQRLTVETEAALWQIGQQRISSEKAIALRQSAEADPETIVRRANAGNGELNLETQDVILRQNAIVTFVEPPMDIRSNNLRWQTQRDQVTSEARVTVVDRAEKVTMAGDRADADIANEVVEFTGNVRGVAELRQSRITADRLKWFAKTQDVEAEGNVNYAQVEPSLEVSGPSATGNLNDEFVTMSGGEVQTTVIPITE